MLLDYRNLEVSPLYTGMLLNYDADLAPTPAVVIEEAQFPQPFSPYDDTITLLDEVTRSWAAYLTLADTFTLLDDISNQIQLFETDTLTLTDASIRIIGKLPTDTLTLTDTSNRIVGLSKADVFTLVDALQKTTGLSKADAYSLADAVAKQTTHTLADVITLLDENTNSYTPGGGGADMTFYRLLLGVG